jgi:hypothetical protein
MAKLLIDNEALAEEYFEDARLLGIQCPVDAARFVWMVNNAFLYDFAYQNNQEVVLEKRRREIRFGLYTCREGHMEVSHLIYINQSEGEYLLPELRYLDYLWLMKGEIPAVGFAETLMQQLRTLPQVQLVTELTNERIRNKQHLVL